MTLEDDLRAQRARWAHLHSDWNNFRVPADALDAGVYAPGVAITKVAPARFTWKPDHPTQQNMFEKVMWERYGIKVQAQQANYRPGTVRPGNIYDEF